jgi:hypothetical protein
MHSLSGSATRRGARDEGRQQRRPDILGFRRATAPDVGNLLFNLAATIPPMRIGGAAARLTTRAARVGAEAEAAAARAATSRAEQAATVAADTVEPASSPPAAPLLTGQDHHAISKKVDRTLEEISGLAGFYRYQDPRFVTKAIDSAAHRGYQTWHRELDAEIAAYIRNKPLMTVDEFENYLRERYAKPDLLAKFPNGL